MKLSNDSTAQPTLIFIPDISGFTKFVHETEISHSEHIIKELLEALIDANEMELQVSEIEGDAVLFYRIGKKPTAVETLAQVQRMYTKFHASLRKYDSQRICQCGACIKANSLALKFIIHYGNISINQVKSSSKLFGKDLIVAHRLMKNDISFKEYVLITHQLLNACSTWIEIDHIAWEKPSQGNGSYDFGDIKYCYLSLAPLEAHIPQPTIENYTSDPKMSKILSVESVINAPIELVFDVVSDTHAKHLWVLHVKASDKTNGKITKNGSTHRCIMNEDENDPFLTSLNFEITKDLITWTDINHIAKSDLLITLRRIGNRLTRINLTVLQRQNPIKKIFYNLFKKKGFVQFYSGSLTKLNEYCQGLEREGRRHSSGILLEPAIKTSSEQNN
ncbi:DUF2652 domain-containing protein [Tamlana sp. 2201CG12-4]|uniref:DUF2652 domain-containing protein n=1 Tax=Tamlana sp. 2201CG12-4 TaxID=3112582 RepID=UPI002DB74F82|nr:DUF2652 domain-containing protein [Tamlana sp. 2201CG12-4]MEC3908199.1 DUF2652 domain-containing protein [Tamlana sp. 2201CG12-4]